MPTSASRPPTPSSIRDGSGFFITFAIDEGELYNFGAVNIESSSARCRCRRTIKGELLTHAGDATTPREIDKTIEKLTLADRRAGLRLRPRSPTRRRPIRRPHTIGITYVIDEGPRIYIERINVIGNMRTKDYVIRREFRLAEGDAYQSAAGRSGQEAPAGPRPLQDRRGQAPPRLGAGPRRSRRGAGRTVDGRAVVRCRLLDE